MPRELKTIETELTDEKSKDKPDEKIVSKLETEVTDRKSYDDDVEKGTASRVKTEKEKLYASIEKHKGDASKATDELAQNQEKLKKLEEAETAREKKATEDVDKKKRSEMEVSERMAALEDENRRKTEETDAKLLQQREEFTAETARKDKAFDDKIKAQELETYRQSVIADAKGQIIPEVVKGNTKEEIDGTVEKAKARYTEIRNGALEADHKKSMTDGKLPGQSGDGKVGPESTPAGGGVDKGGFQEKSVAELATMNKDELAAHKEKVLQQLEASAT